MLQAMIFQQEKHRFGAGKSYPARTSKFLNTTLRKAPDPILLFDPKPPPLSRSRLFYLSVYSRGSEALYLLSPLCKRIHITFNGTHRHFYATKGSTVDCNLLKRSLPTVVRFGIIITCCVSASTMKFNLMRPIRCHVDV